MNFRRSKKLKKNFETISDKAFFDIFYVLEQFLFTTSETKLDCYHQKMNVRVAHKLSNDLILKNISKIKKNP